MSDFNKFIELIKRASVDVNEQKQPCDFLFGTVVSESPLRIRVEQKLELGAAQLVLTKNVTDHKVRISGENIQNFFFDNDGIRKSVVPPHAHALGNMEIEVKNALKVGESVILLKQRGGQKFLVLDRGAEV